MGSDAAVAVLAGKFADLRPHLDERRWRLYLGSEARALAEGGGAGLAAAAALVAAAAGVSRATVMAGAGELADGAEPMAGRSRRPGAGRPRLEDGTPGLGPALLGLVEPSTRGDPVVAVTWTTLSLRDLQRRLAAAGFRCGKDAAARMLREAGYSLQGMSRVLEGSQHPDRDDQFRHVNAMIAEFAAAGDPAVSADAKKKEQLGPYHRAGRSWRPGGDPVRVRDHDFPDPAAGKIAPYGIYDIAANRGFVTVGTSHDTAAFAVGALRRRWRAEGSLRYPGARRLLVTCDADGSNAVRSRLWKHELALLAGETGLEISVCHFPPGTSKWNKIEHRLFCHITRTWRARPLMTAEDAVAGIAATTTYQGLKCTAVLDDAGYPDGVKVSAKRMRHLEERVISRHDEHGEWNYAVRPAPAGRHRNRPPPRRRPLTWEDWPQKPASTTSAPCWKPSPCHGRPSASSASTWPAGTPGTKTAAARPCSRSPPSSPQPPATTASQRPTGSSATSSASTSPPSASPSAASPRSSNSKASPSAAPAAKRQQPPRHTRDSQLKNRRGHTRALLT